MVRKEENISSTTITTTTTITKRLEIKNSFTTTQSS